MFGLMQDEPLLISRLLTHATRFHRSAKIVTARRDGSTVRHTWPEIAGRAARVANALRRRDVAQSERIGSLAWNDHRHLELYYGVSGMGAVLHTINPRLFPDQIAFIINDAADTHLFIDPMFAPIVEGIADRISGVVQTIVMMGCNAEIPESRLGEWFEVLDYESLIGSEPDSIDWPQFDERTASSLCYTSATTGDPKGVLYSHRSTLLHAFAANASDVFGLRAVDTVMPVVPMFHVNAWGTPYAAPMVGASLVLPGPKLDGASLHRLIENEGVTFSAGVPTIWLGLLQHLQESGETFSKPPRLVIGGSACPGALSEILYRDYGVHVFQAWGMTEMSPIGTYNSPKPENAHWSAAEQVAHQKSQGRAIFGVDFRVIGDEGAEIPADGKTFGELQVRGSSVASAYFGRDADPAYTSDGWFRTGDIVTHDASGYIEVVDRAKDVIKSGGEWISSIVLENIAVAHPKVREAAVIGARHPKWDERPLLIVVATEGEALQREEILGFFTGKVAKWWIPDDVLFVKELPHTATGKLLKSALKKIYRNHWIEG